MGGAILGLNSSASMWFNPILLYLKNKYITYIYGKEAKYEILVYIYDISHI
jgi:hypothetical protein